MSRQTLSESYDFGNIVWLAPPKDAGHLVKKEKMGSVRRFWVKNVVIKIKNGMAT